VLLLSRVRSCQLRSYQENGKKANSQQASYMTTFAAVNDTLS